MRPETLHHLRETLFEAREAFKSFVEVSDVIEPTIDVTPRARPTVDDREICSANDFVESTVSLGKQVSQFDLRLSRGNARQSVTDATGGAVVTLSKTGGEDEDSFFHNSSDDAGGTQADEV